MSDLADLDTIERARQCCGSNLPIFPELFWRQLRNIMYDRIVSASKPKTWISTPCLYCFSILQNKTLFIYAQKEQKIRAVRLIERCIVPYLDLNVSFGYFSGLGNVPSQKHSGSRTTDLRNDTNCGRLLITTLLQFSFKKKNVLKYR